MVFNGLDLSTGAVSFGGIEKKYIIVRYTYEYNNDRLVLFVTKFSDLEFIRFW